MTESTPQIDLIMNFVNEWESSCKSGFIEQLLKIMPEDEVGVILYNLELAQKEWEKENSKPSS